MIGEARLKQLYTTMLKCRILDERVRSMSKLSRSKSSGNAAAPAGREAAIVGAVLDLRRDDWLAPTRGDIVLAYLKGLPLTAIFAQLRDEGTRDEGSKDQSPKGKAAGKSPNKAQAKDEAQPQPVPLFSSKESAEARIHLVPPAAKAAHLDLASGLALALQAAKQGAIVMAFCEESTVRSSMDALRFTSLHTLPLVIVTHAVKASAWPSLKDQPPASPRVLIEGHALGVPIIPVDAHDVVAMYRVAHESIHKARHGGGPTLIEARVFDLPVAGATRKVRSPQPPDALAKMEDYLAAKGYFSSAWKQKIADNFHGEVDAAIKIAE